MNDIKTILTTITATCAVSYAVYSIWKGRRVTQVKDYDTTNIWQMEYPKIKSHDYIQYPLQIERQRSHTI